MAEVKEVADTVGVDSLMTAEALPDSLAGAGEEVCGIVFEPLEPLRPDLREKDSSGLSWLLVALLSLFVIISIRFRKSTRFLMAMFNELTEVRERPNTFDDTVREESFLLLLNLLWCLSAGVLLLGLVEYFDISMPVFASLPNSYPLVAAAICCGVAFAYTLFMAIAYLVVGFVFTDYAHAANWMKAFLSAQGLDSLVLFPLALLSITCPGLIGLWLIVAGIALLLTKIIFIYKGYRIFFSETASWVIFLYYLCSLEIVPLIITGFAAFHFCSLLA